MKPAEFVEQYLPFAKEDEALTKVPFLLTLAQGALESSWGENAPGNNFFGIKCGQYWNGKKQLLVTHEIHDNANVHYPVVISVLPLNNGKFVYKVKDYFRVYDSPLDSFSDHSAVLNKNWHDCISSDAIDTITKIQTSGHAYATGPNYVSKIVTIIGMINKYIPQTV